MTLFEFLYAAIGTALSGLGLFGLYRAWQSPQKQTLLVWGCWLAIALALILWAFSGGKDRGVVLGVMVFIIQALGLIGCQASKDRKQAKPPKPVKRRVQAKPKLNGQVIAKRVGVALWVSLGCGALSFLVAMGFHEVFWQSGAHASNALVFALFLFPILWAGLSALSLTSQSKKLKLVTYLGLALPCLAIIMIGN
jgi:hypothetical protein